MWETSENKIRRLSKLGDSVCKIQPNETSEIKKKKTVVLGGSFDKHQLGHQNFVEIVKMM